MQNTQVRFVLYNTIPTRYPDNIDLEKFMPEHPVVKKNKGKVLLYTHVENPIKPSLGNGFSGALWDAYSKHYELVIRPDDVWLAISAAFANYVDSHAEEMRDEFVEHKGKITLEAFGSGSITSTDWLSLIKQFADKIQTYTKDDIRQWMEPSFSTTTKNDTLIGQSMLMGAMKNYFEYKCFLECGIPAVTMLGTLEDWLLVREKAEKLKIMGARYPDLINWYNLLAPVLDQFVESYQNRVDIDFWNRVCHKSGGGSGPSYIEGWVLVFTPFSKGKFILSKQPNKVKTEGYGHSESGLIPASTVEVPVYVNDNGREYNTLLYVGAVVSSYNKEKNQVKPIFNWCLIDITD